MPNLKKTAINATKWTSLSTIIKVFVQIIQLLILARFLTAQDFGLVSIVMVVIGFAQLFMDMGVSNAIIYKQKISDNQLSTLYWLNILFGIGLSIFVYSISPVIASFYGEASLVGLISVLSSTFFINSLGNQHRVLLKKELNFSSIAKIEVLSVLVSFILSVYLAANEYGAYSLVYANLANSVIANIIVLIIGLKWHKPKLIFQISDVKGFLSFGLYQMAQNAIVYFNNQFDVILIGKIFGTETLGAYSLIKQLVMRPSLVLSPIVTNISFPVMAKLQNDTKKLKRVYLKIINIISSINFPIYLFMIVHAKSIIFLFLGEAWSGNEELFQILSLFALIRLITSPSGSLLLAKGRADLGFFWSLASFTVIPIFILIGSNWGEIGVALALLCYQIVFLFPNWFFIVFKICHASLREYFKALQPAIIVSLLSISPALFLMRLNFLSLTSQVSISIFLGVVMTLVSNWVFNKEISREIKGFVDRR